MNPKGVALTTNITGPSGCVTKLPGTIKSDIHTLLRMFQSPSVLTVTKVGREAGGARRASQLRRGNRRGLGVYALEMYTPTGVLVSACFLVCACVCCLEFTKNSPRPSTTGPPTRAREPDVPVPPGETLRRLRQREIENRTNR